MFKKTSFILLMSLALIGSAFAHERGDFILRLGPAGVFPQDSSDSVTGIGGSGVDVDDGNALGITMAYSLSRHFAIGLLAATPFFHNLDGEGSLAALGDIADIKHLPPTLTLQFHPFPDAQVQPYVGAGINYTLFFDEDAHSSLNGALGNTDVDLDDTVGLGLELGVDWMLDENWMLNAALWYLDIDTEATLTTGATKRTVDVEIDPYVGMFAVGYRF